ncbi:MAG TPA: hypothetical protein VGM23_04825, partial [Armatimonadota bacterium]
ERAVYQLHTNEDSHTLQKEVHAIELLIISFYAFEFVNRCVGESGNAAASIFAAGALGLIWALSGKWRFRKWWRGIAIATLVASCLLWSYWHPRQTEGQADGHRTPAVTEAGHSNSPLRSKSAAENASPPAVQQESRQSSPVAVPVTTEHRGTAARVP